MAKIEQVVGAFLNGITMARAYSDVYTKEVSMKYREDKILKYFPVPKVDIKELEFDLKFALGNVKDRLEKEKYVFQKHSELITDKFLPALTGKFSKTTISDLQGVIKEIEENIDVYQKKIEDLIYNRLEQVDSVNHLDVESILHDFYNEEELYRVKGLGINGEIPKPLKDFFREELGMMLHKMGNEIHSVLSRTMSDNMEVIVNTDELKGIPEHLISSVKIKTDVNNYHWGALKKKGYNLEEEIDPNESQYSYLS